MRGIIWYPGFEILVDDITRSEGCSLYDSKGKRYLDLEAGVWCVSVGHGHPRITAAIKRQLELISHNGFCYSSEVVEEAASEVLGLLGFDGGRCTLLCSGSEAVEYCVRVARMLSDRPLFLIMSDSYCGAYGSARERDSAEWFSFDWTECDGCVREECGRGCRRWDSVPWEDIGAFLQEPGSSSGFVRFPPGKLIGAISEQIRASGGFFLVNEVTTGVGRTGEWFGFQHYCVEPDFVALGKGIGNGYPVSVAAFSARAAGLLGGSRVNYAQSHQNDPLAAAVVREVIAVIRDEGLVERARAMGGLLGRGLAGVAERTGAIRAVRARGLLTAVEMAGAGDGGPAEQAHRELARRGYILARRPGTNVLRVDPPLTISESELEEFLTEFEAVLSELQDAGQAEEGVGA